MSNNFDSLSDAQKEVADLIVQNAIDRRTGGKKLTQSQLAEKVGITDRTLRNWYKDKTFLSYLDHLSRLQLQASMPDFTAVLISNLEKGQNLSTKQLDLIAKVADFLPQPKATSNTTYNVQIGMDNIEERIQRLEARRKTIYSAEPLLKANNVEEAEYYESN